MSIYNEITTSDSPLIRGGVLYNITKLREALCQREDYPTEMIDLDKFLVDREQPFIGIDQCMMYCEKEFVIQEDAERFLTRLWFDCACPECKKRAELERGDSFSDEKKSPHKIDIFIKFYLNPTEQWGVVKEYCYDDMKNNYSENVKPIAERLIKKMKYLDFLKTPYWKAIAYKVKKLAKFRCAVCNSFSNLSAHHRTYATHGNEIENLSDLTCLCENCHSKHHKK